MTAKQQQFTFTINGGKERTIKTKTTTYIEAAAACPAKAGVKASDYPLVVSVWVPDLLPDYGPYDYYIDKPGGQVAIYIERWDGQKIAAYS